MNFNEQLEAKTIEIEGIIKSYLPKEEGFSSEIAKTMNYSMLAGGKRLRPMLMKETFLLFGGESKAVEPFMAAIEMIHTHSLIHDDLPALDNDDFRRGKETTHIKFGEDMAILAGDALLNYAYETAFLAFSNESVSIEKTAKALQILADKTGIFGMLGGQSVDVKNEGKSLSKDMLEYIYVNKTSALIEASMMIGAVLANATDEEVFLIESVAYKVGLAFQIQDDILDVISTKELLGKPICSDQKNQKTTYVTLYGIEAAKEKVKDLSIDAIETLNDLEGKNEYLVRLLESLITRIK